MYDLEVKRLSQEALGRVLTLLVLKFGGRGAHPRTHGGGTRGYQGENT